MPGGRPSKYEPRYHPEQAFKFGLLGLTDEELAGQFDITVSTLNNWKEKHEEFFVALKEGKDGADGKVAASLYHRARGYSHKEDKIFNNNGEPLIVPTVKHYPPDTTAAIFWLKNRQRGKWRDVRNTEVTGAGGGPVKTEQSLDLSGLSDKELAALEQLIIKAATAEPETGD